MGIAGSIFALVLRFGGLGLLVVGILDSSYLFAPWGNDLLVVAMTARHPSVANAIYYAAMSAIGSALGCLVIDITLRPLGAKGLERYLSGRRLDQVRSRIGRNAGRALAIASLAPPPFPFTAFVMGAATLQYPRRRLVTVVGVTRMLRFSLLGLLALRFGESILKWAQNPMVQGFLVALIIFCTVGSIWSVYVWIKRSRSQSAGHQRVQQHVSARRTR